jgi:hypothetical protein
MKVCGRELIGKVPYINPYKTQMIPEKEQKEEEGNKCMTNGCTCYKSIKMNSLKHRHRISL